MPCPLNLIGRPKTLLHPGDYLDTYFRLLREDCISAIRQSIADVRDRGKNADKAKADGNVFNAKLKGITVGKGDIAIDQSNWGEMKIVFSAWASTCKDNI